MKYAAKKIVWMLLTMVIVSFLAFSGLSHHSRRPHRQAAGEQATPERVEALRQELGLDRRFWSGTSAGWGISSGGTWARRTITVCR